MRVCIIGTGYVGLTTGVCLAYLGHDVTCVDNDAAKVDLLQAGKTPIYEPHLEDLLREASPRLRFTTDYATAVPGAEVIFIAVGTPLGVNGAPDLRYLAGAAQSIGAHLYGPFCVVVNKSTVPIGSGHWVDTLLRESYLSHHGGTPQSQFSVASNPEFLREGSALSDTLYPDRVVIGASDDRSLEHLYTLYRPILDQTFTAPSYVPRPDGFGAVPLISTDLASAELIKYAANAFLALKISYINEIGTLADKVGADIAQVAKGIGLDQRIGTRFLSAGLGWGGSCFGKDTAALISTAGEYGLAMPIVGAAREVNLRQRALVVDKLLAELRILKGRTIGILGLAFKPHTDDLRESPAIDIAKNLLERGCKVRVHDPVAMERFAQEYPALDVTPCTEGDGVAAGADAVILATEWPQYRDLDWQAMRGTMRTPVLLDGRNLLDRKRLLGYGFRYLALSSALEPERSATSN